MQTRKKINSNLEILCETTIVSEINNALKRCYDVNLPDNLILLCRKAEKYIDIFAISKSCMDKVLKRVIEFAWSHMVSVGVHVFRKQLDKLLPMLGLLNFIKPRKGYVVVNYEGMKHFLYGKDVLHNNIIEIVEFPADCELPYIVMGPKGEAVGYGRFAVFKGKPLIRNVLDLGWYLRSGV